MMAAGKLKDWRHKRIQSYLPVNYPFFTAGLLPVVFFGLAGLDLPNEPLNLFPFAVFLSPLPIKNLFKM